MKFRSSVLAAVCLAVAVLVSGSARSGGFMDGNKLHSMCQREKASFMEGVCVGAITSVADALTELSILGQSLSGYRACIPNQIQASQVIDVAKQYLERNPSMRHFTAFSLVTIALAEAWPCPKK